MNRVSIPAVLAAVFILLAFVCLYGDWDRHVAQAYICGMAAITAAILSLRDR